jgi:hypothetical protein
MRSGRSRHPSRRRDVDGRGTSGRRSEPARAGSVHVAETNRPAAASRRTAATVTRCSPASIVERPSVGKSIGELMMNIGALSVSRQGVHSGPESPNDVLDGSRGSPPRAPPRCCDPPTPTRIRTPRRSSTAPPHAVRRQPTPRARPRPRRRSNPHRRRRRIDLHPGPTCRGHTEPQLRTGRHPSRSADNGPYSYAETEPKEAH